MENSKGRSIALFIDADNTSYKYGKCIMDVLQAEGNVFIRRIYGNWQKSLLHSWNDNILLYGMNAVQQMDFVVGKNASDMLITIDAMDILHQGMADTFAIASSDSDFTPLAMRLRESGIHVIGLGREQSSHVFQHVCNEFIYLDKLLDDQPEPKKTAATDTAKKPTRKTGRKISASMLAQSQSLPLPAPKAAPQTQSSDIPALAPVPVQQAAPQAAKKNTNAAKTKAQPKQKNQPDPMLQSKEDKIHNFLQKLMEKHADENGFMALGQAGKILKNELGYSTKEIGYSTLSKFLTSFPKRYEVIGIGKAGRPGTSKFRCK